METKENKNTKSTLCLKTLEKQLDDVLNKESSKSLKKWIKSKRKNKTK